MLSVVSFLMFQIWQILKAFVKDWTTEKIHEVALIVLTHVLSNFYSIVYFIFPFFFPFLFSNRLAQIIWKVNNH